MSRDTARLTFSNQLTEKQMSSLPAEGLITDPNHLATIIRCFRGIISDDGDRSRSSSPYKSNIRKPHVLDSLAYVSANRRRKQVAVGIVLPNPRPFSPASGANSGLEPGIRVIVAANPAVKGATVNYLSEIFKRLRKTHELLSLSTEKPTRLSLAWIPTDSESPYLRELASLELLILKHLWGKLRHQFIKNARPERFNDVLADVLGDTASERSDLDCYQRNFSADLQKIPDCLTLPIDGQILCMEFAVTALVGLFKDESPNFECLDDARTVLYAVERWAKYLRSEEIFLQKWDSYTSRELPPLTMTCIRFKLRWSVVIKKVEANELANSDQDKRPNDHSGKAPNLLRWLLKMSAVCEHFRCIADIALSRTLEAWLLGPIQVIPIGQPTHRIQTVIEKRGLQTILAQASCDKVEERIDNFWYDFSRALDRETLLSNQLMHASKNAIS